MKLPDHDEEAPHATALATETADERPAAEPPQPRQVPSEWRIPTAPPPV